MSKKLAYIADLTYIGQGINSGTFPFGLGHVAAYANTHAGERQECEVFKLPDELNDALKDQIPAMLRHSHDVWNRHLIGLNVKTIREAQSLDTTVCGSPKFPVDQQRPKTFLESSKRIKFYDAGERIELMEDKIKCRTTGSTVNHAEFFQKADLGLMHRNVKSIS